MVLRIGSDGVAQRVAGTGKPGYSGDNGPAVEADLGPSSGLAVDRFGYVYIADRTANTIRIADPSGVITTWAGSPNPSGGFSGDLRHAGEARFSHISGIVLDTGDYLVVADTGNLRIRRADNVDVFRTVGGTDAFRGDRGNSTTAWLFGPTSVAVDGGGNVLIADSLNNRIRRVTSTRSIDTVAGGGAEPVISATAGRDARDLRLDLSSGAAVAIDERGNLIFNSAVPVPLAGAADAPSQAVLTMSPSSLVTGIALGRIGEVGGVVRGRSGEIYVSDPQNHRIWRFGADGTAATIAGTGAAGYTGDGGQAVTAQLNTPRSLAVNADGDLFVAEVGRIRKITTAGRISTVAFENATGLAVDRDGTLYVASGRSVYMTAPDRRDRTLLTLVRIAGREGGTPVTNNIPGLDAAVTDLRGLAAGPSGELVFADYGENAVRRLLRNVPEVVSLVSGDGQTLNDRFVLPTPIRLQVTGRNGAPVAGVTVRFINVTDRAKPTQLSAVLTDATGSVSFNPRLPANVPEFRLEAYVFGVPTPAAITITGRADTPPEQ
jgi:hypothetical protein